MQIKERTPFKKQKNRRVPRWLWWLVCLPLALALSLAARLVPGFAQWYAVHLYPLLAQGVNALSALVPFSTMETVIALLTVLGVVLLVRLAAKLVRAGAARPRLRLLGEAVLKLGCAASAALLAFVLLCGINYHRDTFARSSGLPLEKSTVAELETLCRDLAAQANALSEQIETHDAAGVTDLTGGGFAPLAQAVDEAYALAAQVYPQLGGSCRHAKPMLASGLMSRLQLTGIFFPFTMESNVNRLAPAYNVPVTIGHELAHLRGFMREDEANYIGYYVCSLSPDVRLQYSGVMLALVHAGNALARTDGEAYGALRATYGPQVLRDFAANNAYWAQYDDTTLSELSEKTNDAYLKANGQQDGTRSYGRMVDLLLAQWRAEGRLENAR